MAAKTFRELTGNSTPALTRIISTQAPTGSDEPEKSTLTELQTALVTTAAVTAAGAAMDSEFTDLAGVKGVTISTLQPKPTEGAFADGDKTKLDGIQAGATKFAATDVKTSGYTAVSGDLVLTDSSGGAFPVTLPASPSAGDVVGILDVTDSWAAENVTVGRNSSNIEGAAEDLVLDGGRYCELRYAGATPGWVLNFVSNATPAPAATTDTAGLLEVATTAEVRSSATGKGLVANNVEDASAIVTLTDAATITVDWDAFINGAVTITDNRTLGLPTNGQPGTWRTIDVIQDGSGAHTLAFASGYQFAGGTAPTVTATAAARSKLSIFCRTTSVFEVFSALDIKAPA